MKDSRYIPDININKCESDEHCVIQCPNDVLEMRVITDDEYKALSMIGKLKARVHGREKAFVIYPDECIGCGECVKVCPEKAIKMVEFLVVEAE